MEKRNDLLPIILEKFEEIGIEAKNEPVKIFHIRDESMQRYDVWNDKLCFIDNSNNVWISKGTTDPGSNSYHRHPEGSAHICLGWHRKVWVIDIHARSNKLFAHEALCNRPERGCRSISYFRDQNKNRIFDSSDIKLYNFVGLNCHRASAIKDAAYIGDYSDGCQVRLNIGDHLFFMSKLKEFQCVRDSLKNEKYGYLFSFLLIDIKDIKI
jgi:hypothetical protein